MPLSQSRRQLRPRPKPNYHVSSTDREDASDTQDSQLLQSAPHDPVDSFRFRELPLELREKVYKYALEPKAEFRVGSLSGMPRWTFQRPTMELWTPPGEETDDNGHDDESGNIDPNIRIWNDHVGRKGRATVMTFRLAMSTPIQLVSKEALFAVKRPLEKLRKSLAAQIYLQRIKEPTQDFLDVVSRSRFAIDAGPVETLFLVKHLPASIKPRVKEIAFSLQLWDNVGELWGSSSGDGCEVTNTLCSELPNLRTIAMQVPRSLEEHDDWVAASLHHIHDLLQSKRIDAVRIFHYRGSVEEEEWYPDADEELEKIYRKEFGPRIDVPDPEEIPPCTKHSSSYIETKQREFDVVKVPSWTQWMNEPRFMEKELRARTIEITRWEDTRLGSRTYKQIVVGSKDLSGAGASSGAASVAASGAASASASGAN